MCPVYSTDIGKVCPACNQVKCRCHKSCTPIGNGHVRISLETKGRKGKGVTIIRQLPLEEEALKQLLKKLKQKTSTGGTIKEGNIELQGDQRQALLKLLEAYNFASVKISGGH